MIDNPDFKPIPHSYRRSYLRTFLAEHHPLFFLLLGVTGIATALISIEPFFSFVLKEALLPLLMVILFVLLYLMLTAERRAIRKFLRVAQIEQEPYKHMYVALSASQNEDASAAQLPYTSSSHPQQDVQEVLQEQDKHLLLLGAPGAGKTVALHVHQYDALEKCTARGTSKIPLFIPLKDYNAFLRDTASDNGQEVEEDKVSPPLLEQTPLIRYLALGTLPGTKDIRRYVRKWMLKGRLLLLCDGLNEINIRYQPFVCTELLRLMHETTNRVVMTCRELDFNDQLIFHPLVGERYALRENLQPLRSDQIKEFVTKFIDESLASGKRQQYTADEIVDLIKNTRLQYECTNPLMLAILIETVNSTDLETGRRLDTRGKLWQAAVDNWIREELKKERWKNAPFKPEDVVSLLRQVAYIARRRSKDSRNALPLGKAVSSKGGVKKKHTIKDWANELDLLLVDPRGEGSTITAREELFIQTFPQPTLWKLLEFIRQARLVVISSDNLLSFRHELIAEYFVAEYLQYAVPKKLRQTKLSPGVEVILVELIKHIGDWKEPVGIWAGLLDNPLDLADRLAFLGITYPDYGFNALTLCLLCLGIKLGTIEVQAKSVYMLTEHIKTLFHKHVDSKEKRAILAQTINECAQEGGVGVYRAFLPLLRAPHIDTLILLLDNSTVPGLLFDHLVEIIDKNVEASVLPAIIGILGKFGAASIQLAIKGSQPNTPGYTLTPDKQILVRQAAIEILGLTHDHAAVDPLITYLTDSSEIREVARKALIGLGPDLTLSAILKELTRHTSIQPIENIHFAILSILAEFIKGQGEQALEPSDYRRVIQALLHVLSSAYTERIQQVAEVLLSREVGLNAEHRNWILQQLILQLSTTDARVELHSKEILRQAGSNATPLLLRYLKQLSLETEIQCERIVEILGMICDLTALHDLIGLIVTPYTKVRKQVAKVLFLYRTESVPNLIDAVLHKSYAEAVAAQKILEEIGQDCVGAVCEALSGIIPGRTQILIEVLAHVHDTQAIPHLINFLKPALHEEGLAVPTIHALSEFSDQRIVTSLLEVLELSKTTTAIYDEAVAALSRLGEVALGSLIDAMDVKCETAATRGVRDALVHIHMNPFPSSRLLEAVAQASEEQEKQIMDVFLAKGDAVSPFLVNCLCISQERERKFVQQTLDQMDAHDSIPALLHGVDHPTCLPEVARYLKKYREITTSLLVNQLADTQYGIGSAKALTYFGPAIISSLVPGLNNENKQARSLTQEVITNLTTQHPEIIAEVIMLFRVLHLPEERRAFESLISILIEPLASMSFPFLLNDLASEYSMVKVGARESLVSLVRLGNEQSSTALNGLISSLQYVDERRDEAAEALIQIGDLVIPGINALITDNNPAVSKKARYILSRLPGVLLTIYDDLTDSKREGAVLEILCSMRTADIKGPLITLLMSDDVQKVRTAVTLLLIRIHADVYTQNTDKNMLPSLLEHIQQQERGNDIMRIVTFLLLLPGDLVFTCLRQFLSHSPVSKEWLIPLFLLLDMRGTDAKRLLIEALGNSRISNSLYAQIMGLLGMIDRDRESYAPRWSANINQPSQQGGWISPERLAIAQRALGGLLVSGRWNSYELQELLNQETQLMVSARSEESERHELYTVLLGGSYVPRISAFRNQLTVAQAEIEIQRQSIRSLELRIAQKEEELKQVSNKLTREQSENAAHESENSRLTTENHRLKEEKRQAEQQAVESLRQYEATQRLLETYRSLSTHQ